MKTFKNKKGKLIDSNSQLVSLRLPKMLLELIEKRKKKERSTSNGEVIRDAISLFFLSDLVSYDIKRLRDFSKEQISSKEKFMSNQLEVLNIIIQRCEVVEQSKKELIKLKDKVIEGRKEFVKKLEELVE